MDKRLIEGENIVLYSTEYEDLDKVIEIEKSEDNKRFIFSWPKQRHVTAIDNEDEGHIIIKLKDSDKIIGYVLLAGLRGDDNAIELRRIAITDKGKGYGRESLRLIKRLAFKQYQSHRLWLDVYDDNSRAIVLYIQEGFKIEGVLRECRRRENKYSSMIIMGLLEDEYID